MVASKLEYYEQLLGQNMESFLIEQYLIEWVYTVPVIEQNVHLYFDKLLVC